MSERSPNDCREAFEEWHKTTEPSDEIKAIIESGFSGSRWDADKETVWKAWGAAWSRVQTTPDSVPEPSMKFFGKVVAAPYPLLSSPSQPASALVDPDMPEQQLRLHLGELSAGEVRTARAAIRWANSVRQHMEAKPAKDERYKCGFDDGYDAAKSEMNQHMEAKPPVLRSLPAEEIAELHKQWVDAGCPLALIRDAGDADSAYSVTVEAKPQPDELIAKLARRYLAAEQAFADDGMPDKWVEYEEAKAALEAALSSQDNGGANGN